MWHGEDTRAKTWGRLMKSGFYVCMLFLAFTTPGLRAQNPEPAKPAEEQPKKITPKEYLRRAGIITAATEQDMWRLNHDDQTLLKARLGSLWWKTDQARARAWIESAVSEIERGTANPTAQQSKSRITLAEYVLSIASSLDKDWSDRLTKSIHNAALDLRKSGGGRPYASSSRIGLGATVDAVYQKAIALLPKDTKRAAEAGEDLLVVGGGIYFLEFMEKLREVDPAAADALYQKAIQNAAQTYDTETLFLLGDYEYSIRGFVDEQKSNTPQPLRDMVLAAIVQTVSSGFGEDGATKEQCDDVQAAGVYMSFYTPEEAKIVQTMTAECGVRYPRKEDSPSSSNLGPVESDTTDSLLTRAAAELDPKARGNLKMWAAERARSKDGDFQRSLDILDGFTDEERADVPGWRNAREIPALQAMWISFRGEDTTRMQAIIDHTPDRIRTSFLLRFVEMLQRNKETDFAQILFVEARKNYERYGDEDELKTAQWLIQDCAVLPGCDHLPILKDAAAAIDRWTLINPQTHKPRNDLSYSELDRAHSFSGLNSAANWEFDSVHAAWAGINDSAKRAAVRMTFLKELLSRAQPPPVEAKPAQNPKD